MTQQRTAIVGGGAAGFFLAINLKTMCPQMEVTILEAAQKVLRKVEVSGGGRCNLTNSFEDVADLQSVYPRGHRLLKRLFNVFDYRDAYRWFEQRGVKLVTQADGCVFPASQDSHTIINLFLAEARRLGIVVKTGIRVSTLDELADFDYVCITTGGHPREDALRWLQHPIEKPVPSLFTLSIADAPLNSLMGTVVGQAQAMIPGTKLRAQGPLLITHWGMSGPCILRLSSYAARQLSEVGYRSPLLVNWTGLSDAEVSDKLTVAAQRMPQKQLPTQGLFELPQRLWAYLAEKSLGQRAHAPWGSLNKKELQRLTHTLTQDSYLTTGRAPHRDEFVTCGGVSLKAVSPQTLESRAREHLYFSGEVLDIDGVTGGFNFQAAWTTAYTVARAIGDSQK